MTRIQYDPSYRDGIIEDRMVRVGTETREVAPARAAYFRAREAAARSANNPFAERDRKDRERLAQHQRREVISQRTIADWNKRKTA